MAVPKMSQLHPGTSVNIVLKADQKTGRLTTGNISDFLTRGDHPRGIKVRLTSGLIGRVQSISSASETTSAITSNTVPLATSEYTPTMQQSRATPVFKLQDDYRNDPKPQESLSLEDYIKPARKKGKKKAAIAIPAPPAPAETGDSIVKTQAELQIEFPNIDSALIAAILADHSTVQEAREVLEALS